LQNFFVPLEVDAMENFEIFHSSGISRGISARRLGGNLQNKDAAGNHLYFGFTPSVALLLL